MFYAFAREQGMAPDLVKSVVTDYLTEAQANDNTVTDAMVARFHKKYASRLSQTARDGLVAWIRSSS